MVQQIGETRDAIMSDMNDRVMSIISSNRNKKEPYWIVLFVKSTKEKVDGKHVLRQHVKAYARKPASQVGMIIAEVNNLTGEIKWEVNMPQKPFDFDLLKVYGAEDCDEIVTETTSIASSYICQ